MTDGWIRASGGGTELDVIVVPRASRTEVTGIHEDRLRVRVAAPPVEGKANEALIRYFSKIVGSRRSAVVIRSGESGRRKVIRIDGVDPEDVRRSLGKELGESI